MNATVESLAPGLFADALAGLEPVVEMRRAIHRQPELGLHNPRTRDRIVGSLAGLDLSVRTGGDATWVLADLDGGPGPTVLLRADTDALPMTEDTDLAFRSAVPGAAHTCGHDAHTAMLVGAARVLAARRDELHGTVRFAFQPGEEVGGGAQQMIAEGALDGVDGAYAVHVTPNIPSGFVSSRPGPIMASSDEFTITVRGRGGHASTPHFCTDPVTVAAHVVTALQTMVTREINAMDPVVVTVTRMAAGTAANVIPETALLAGTIRAVSEMSRLHVHEALRRVVTGVVTAHDATAEVAIESGYPVTVNDPTAVGHFESAARTALGTDMWFELPFPVMGAEDFSYFLHEVPGAMALLGVCPEEIDDSLTAPPCHSNRMTMHEPAMAAGVALHATTALTALAALG